MKRGELYWADLVPRSGSKQTGLADGGPSSWSKQSGALPLESLA